jgi:hypothetical protein
LRLWRLKKKTPIEPAIPIEFPSGEKTACVIQPLPQQAIGTTRLAELGEIRSSVSGTWVPSKTGTRGWEYSRTAVDVEVGRMGAVKVGGMGVFMAGNGAGVPPQPVIRQAAMIDIEIQGEIFRVFIFSPICKLFKRSMGWLSGSDGMGETPSQGCAIPGKLRLGAGSRAAVRLEPELGGINLETTPCSPIIV